MAVGNSQKGSKKWRQEIFPSDRKFSGGKSRSHKRKSEKGKKVSVHIESRRTGFPYPSVRLPRFPSNNRQKLFYTSHSGNRREMASISVGNEDDEFGWDSISSPNISPQEISAPMEDFLKKYGLFWHCRCRPKIAAVFPSHMRRDFFFRNLKLYAHLFSCIWEYTVLNFRCGVTAASE